MRNPIFKSLFFVVILLAGTIALPVEALDFGACCDEMTGDCYISEEWECIYTWLGPGTDCSMCQPMVEPCEPVLRVGDWLIAEPWHNWIPANKETHVQLHVFDPCELIYRVDFYYSPDGDDWYLFHTDHDGTEPTLGSNGAAQEEGDGWSGYLPPEIIPVQDCTTVQFKAEAYYHIDSFFDVYTERVYDFTPPDSVSTNVEDFDQIEEYLIYLDVDPISADIAEVYYSVEPKPNEFDKGIPKVEQRKAAREHGGDYHCSPTAAAACLKYFEGQGDPNICGGLDDANDLVDALAELAKTNQGKKGTKLSDLLNALRLWIANHGDGYTVRSPIDVNDFNNIDEDIWKLLRDELERCQDVLLNIDWPDAGNHTMTLNSVVNKPLPDGKVEIDFMDPWTGEYQTGKLDPNTGELSEFDSTSGDGGELYGPIIICPKEDDPNGGTGGAGQQPGPDPGGVVIPLALGLNRITVTVVDTCGNAATIVRILERIDECFPVNHPDYVEWVSVGKPACWCNPRQCHGDADGLEESYGPGGMFKTWCGVDDIAILLDGFRKPYGGDPSVDTWICADFDHKEKSYGPGGMFKARVGVDDIAILLAYFRQPVPPDCLN